MTEKKFTIGQQVLMARTYGKPVLASVVKIGRKYAHIQQGNASMDVDLITGREKSGFGHAFTLPEWEERIRFAEVSAELRAHGIGPVGSGHFKQSIVTLEALLAVLQKVTD